MATYCPEDLASRELSCPICFEDYDIQDDKRSPKLLLCLHTFCFDCTRKLWQNDGSIECSLCRMLHEEVRLDDLLDNHVIVQHLRRQFEERDLEMARRIDQELRDLDSLAPAGASDVAEIKLQVEKNVYDIPDSPEVVNISSEQEQEEEDDQVLDAEEEDPEDQEEHRHYILNNFLEEFMEGLNSPGMHINQESEDNDDSDDRDDDDDDDNSEEHEEIQEVEAQEEVSDDEEEEATNPFYSLHNIHSLLEEAEEENTGGIFEVHNIQTILDMTENEENDAEDEEEEDDDRWHSASDDINDACWSNESLPLNDVNEMEDDTPEIFDWHIINSESLLDD